MHIIIKFAKVPKSQSSAEIFKSIKRAPIITIIPAAHVTTCGVPCFCGFFGKLSGKSYLLPWHIKSFCCTQLIHKKDGCEPCKRANLLQLSAYFIKPDGIHRGGYRGKDVNFIQSATMPESTSAVPVYTIVQTISVPIIPYREAFCGFLVSSAALKLHLRQRMQRILKMRPIKRP